MLNRLFTFLIGGEVAEEYGLSDGGSIIIIMDSADPVYISFYSSFPMLTTLPKTLTEIRILTVKTMRTNRRWSSD